MAVEKEVSDKKRQRSPNYPAIGLRAAVERVRALYVSDGRPGAPLATAVKHFGFGGPHGQAMGVVSALKKFGLIEDRNGRIVPTPLAVNVMEFGPEHARHRNSLQEAALKPEVYAGLVDQYREHNRLPSDEALRPELITDKGFNPRAVNGFLADFRDTLEYAGLLEGNSLKLSSSGETEDNPVEEDDEQGGEEMDTDSTAAERTRADGAALLHSSGGRDPMPSKESWPGPSVRFDLPRGNAIEIRLRSKISKEELQKVKSAFELLAQLSFVEDTESGAGG